jgi:hypothetical protein
VQLRIGECFVTIPQPHLSPSSRFSPGRRVE